ncbi:helix-turn-helix domain-containing protein [Cronobacter malonaticus]|uniref:helix-turn-helix domain-containing protein n=1 Tax=Enterobacter sp. EC_50 TaxID=2584088 RepID=UPI001C700424|nr:helix-turn-helix domain-containing protein [Enterobacter sp. EC_50]MBW9446294.1 winged helix-turn-helix domain-containing protein [Enterobacter sp. EC_50]HCT9403222.1 winged helix-turn-helix domain-containing protein [Enterobacter hormaechei]
MAKTLAEIKADPKYQYTDKDGKVRDRTINIPHYFREIPRIYSPNLENGFMDFCPKAQKLYCYFQGWENSGNFCYESQTELGKVIDLSREHTCKLIQKLQDAGLITKEKNPGYRSKVYRTFPITDAHITPPEALTVQPVAASDEVPAPEPVKTVETHEDTPAITPQRIRTSDAVKHLLENLSQRREDESFYSWSSRVLQRIGIDHSMGIEQLFQETHPYEYTQIEQSTIPF